MLPVYQKKLHKDINKFKAHATVPTRRSEHIYQTQLNGCQDNSHSFADRFLTVKIKKDFHHHLPHHNLYSYRKGSRFLTHVLECNSYKCRKHYTVFENGKASSLPGF